MIDFIIANWQWIAALGVSVIELVLFIIFKRRPTIIDNSIVFKISTWIEEAETIYRKGVDKLNYVLDKAKLYLGSQFNEQSVTELVEFILSLPQKKGDK